MATYKAYCLGMNLPFYYRAENYNSDQTGLCSKRSGIFAWHQHLLSSNRLALPMKISVPNRWVDIALNTSLRKRKHE